MHVANERSGLTWSGCLGDEQERFGRTKGTLILSGDSSVKRMDDAHMLKLEPKRRARKRVLRVRFTKVRWCCAAATRTDRCSRQACGTGAVPHL